MNNPDLRSAPAQEAQGRCGPVSCSANDGQGRFGRCSLGWLQQLSGAALPVHVQGWDTARADCASLRGHREMFHRSRAPPVEGGNASGSFYMVA